MRLTFALACALLLSRGALAQDGAAEAEQLFLQANEAYQAEQFPAARELLQRSLRADGSVSAAYNLAIVEQSMGLFIEAEATLSRLIDGHYGQPRRRERRQAEALRRDVHEEQSTIMVTLRGGAGTLVIDGDTVAELRDGVEHTRRINPGDRRIAAVGERGARAGAQVSALPGRSFEVELFLLEEQRSTAPPAQRSAEGRDDIPRNRRPLRVGFSIAAILLVGAAVAVTVIAVKPQPYEDDFFPTATALSFGP